MWTRAYGAGRTPELTRPHEIVQNSFDQGAVFHLVFTNLQHGDAIDAAARTRTHGAGQLSIADRPFASAGR
jgi:hypothetical protein